MLQVRPQAMNFIKDKVHVLGADPGADDDHPEEVGIDSMGLVAHHHAARLHHALLDLWRHLEGKQTENIHQNASWELFVADTC